MGSITKVRQHRAAKAYGFKALPAEGDGVFEAYVSVFDNVDFANERVHPGAFAKSLEAWRSSGDPIPVIFSHQWDDLDAHVGIVTVAEEHLAGDARLPTELAALGGLYIKGKLDVDEDFAGRLWKRMARRSIKEFSFAYDVDRAKPDADGALGLLELDLIEVGPTLKGMNPATVLVAAKAGALAKDAGKALVALDALELADNLVDDLTGTFKQSVAGEDLVVPTEKRLPSAALPDGAIEPVLGAIHDAADVWAQLQYGRDYYWLHLEATLLEEGHAIVTAERWQDPIGEGPLWDLAFSFADDGTVEITEATELEVTVELAAKRSERAATEAAALGRLGRKLANAPITPATSSTVPTVPSGKAEEHTAKAEDQPGDSIEAALLEADLLEVDLGV